MFNFSFRRGTQAQKIQTAKNSKRTPINLKKTVSTSSFVYGSKKIAFTVRSREDYWKDIENLLNTNQDLFELFVINKINEIMQFDKDESEENIYEDLIYKPVSGPLAICLLLLNQNYFKSKIFNDYLNSEKHQVYDYTHWNGQSFLNNADKLEIENPFSAEEEEYKQILPGYKNIDAVKFYKGCQLLKTSQNSDTYFINTPLNFYGSYNLDQNKFQRIYKDYINDQIKSVSAIKDYNTLDNRTELLNKYPELDSYLYVDGLFNKLKDSPYNSQTYQISILRGGYGFGPLIISYFLKLIDFDDSKLTDIILSLLLSADSGMILGDAIKGIREWRGISNDSDIFSFIDSEVYSDIQILKILEYAGTLFLMLILGSQLKDQSSFKLSFDIYDTKLLNIGSIIGNSFDTLKVILKRILAENLKTTLAKPILNETEVFTFEVPCVMKKDGKTETKGTFNMMDFSKNFSDLIFDNEPMETLFGIKKIIDKENKLTDYIIPNTGYTIYDFITKGLNKCLIEQVIKNIQEFSNTSKKYSSKTNSYFKQIYTSDIGLISPSLSSDLLITPRKSRNLKIQKLDSSNLYSADYTAINSTVDTSKCRVLFNLDDNTWDSIGQLKDTNYTTRTHTVILASQYDEAYIVIDGVKTTKNYNVSIIPMMYDDTSTFYIDVGTIFYANNVKYTVIERKNLSDDFKIDSTFRLIYKKNPSKVDTFSGKKLFTYKIENIKVTDEMGNYHNMTIDKFKMVADTGSTDNNYIILNFGSVRHNDELYNPIYLERHVMTDRINCLGNFNNLKTVNVQDRIAQLFQECGFYFDLETSQLKTIARYRKVDESYPIYKFINSFALCILKLSFINSFFVSYSLDLLGVDNSTKEFYNILSDYLSDFLTVKQNYTKPTTNFY